ncbi:MAG: amidase [Rhizobiaceae bacterium]|nr:amidase [Rhizobiaceae bacterium]
MNSRTFATLARDLAEGKTTSEALTEECLAAALDTGGEGARTFIYVDADGARAQARAMDALRAAGTPLSPYTGIPISIKDLFDVAGQVTRAGSVVLSDEPPAARDAEIVSRLRRAGMVLVGRTNMSEFAFSGVGINPHYGTPTAAWDRISKRVPGGSSSGAAISVVDGMAHGAIGTDTGGSCRIPAAFGGLVGYKPTARMVPLDGAIPLSSSLDSIGPIARTVDCCASLTAMLASVPGFEDASDLKGKRFAVPSNFVMDGVDATVASVFDKALAALSRAGAIVETVTIPALDRIASINSLGGFPAAESYFWHRALLERDADRYDQRVRVRIERGKGQSAADYMELLRSRAALIEDVRVQLQDFDAVAMPTVPIIPPRITELDDDQDFARINLLLLRNPTVINLLDGCAISLPAHAQGDAPVGLMIAMSGGRDADLFRLARSVEKLVSPH